MNGYLRQSTASQARTIGPFIDDGDFKTLENGLTINNTDIVISKNGAADTTKNSGGATAHGAGGIYTLTWDATDTNTVGELYFSVKVSGALVVFGSYVVLEEAVYDALYASSAPGYLQPATAGRTLVVSAAGAADANLTAIEGTAPLSSATFNLRQLNVVNNGGSAIVASATGSNGHGIAASGNGAGEGISAIGGATGAGIECNGGATSGDGFSASAISGNGNGIRALGQGSGEGISAQGGTTGNGFEATGGGTSGNGIVGNGGTNGHGLRAVGNGSGEGISAQGGATGHGLESTGGATSGYGAKFLGQGASEVGIDAQGGLYGINAAGATIGILATGAVDGPGIKAVGSGNGSGLDVTGAGSGAGFRAIGGSAGSGIRAVGVGSGNGFEAIGGDTDANGIVGQGGGAGAGLGAFGGDTGHGSSFLGGASGGVGWRVSSQTSHGVQFLGAGNGAGLVAAGAGLGSGIEATGGATGHGILATGGATSGTGIRAEAATDGDGIEAIGAGSGFDIDADIQGSLSGAVGSVTGNVGGNVVGSVASVAGNVDGNVTGSIGGLTAGALADFFTTDSGETYASSVAGSVVKEIADNAGGSSLTVQQIVDGVWDEPLASHLDAGSTGEALSNAAAGADPAAIADAVWDEDATGHQTQGSFGQTIGDAGADTDTIYSLATGIQADTDDIQTRLPASLNGGRMRSHVEALDAGVITAVVAPNLDAAVSTRATPAQVNGEVLDVLNVDTFAEPTGVPGATVTLAEKIGRLYQVLRNRLTISSATGKLQLYNDANAVIWEKDVTDNGTVYDESEGNAP